MKTFIFTGKCMSTGAIIQGSILNGVDYFGNPVSYIYPSNTKIDSRGVTENYVGMQVFPGSVSLTYIDDETYAGD